VKCIAFAVISCWVFSCVSLCTLWHRQSNKEVVKVNSSTDLNETLIKCRSFATAVSQLKISDFSGEMFKGFEVLSFSMSAKTTQLLSSG